MMFMVWVYVVTGVGFVFSCSFVCLLVKLVILVLVFSFLWVCCIWIMQIPKLVVGLVDWCVVLGLWW